MQGPERGRITTNKSPHKEAGGVAGGAASGIITLSARKQEFGLFLGIFFTLLFTFVLVFIALYSGFNVVIDRCIVHLEFHTVQHQILKNFLVITPC